MAEPETIPAEEKAESEAAPASGREQVTEPSVAKVRLDDADVGPLGAYEALAKAPRLEDLIAITKSIVGEAAEARRTEWSFGAKVAAAAAEAKLPRAEAGTPYGNALKVLESGPEDRAEAALACALWAHAVSESSRDDDERVAGDVLWLASHTAFDATSLVDRALGEDANDFWAAVADRVRDIAEGRGRTLGRAEALVGCAALASSPRAAKAREELAAALADPVMLRVLDADKTTGPAEVRLEGESVAPPRGPVATALLALSGILFLVGAARLLARVALAYRCPAEVTLSGAGVRVKTRTEMLGKVLREREHVIPKSALDRVVREVRYPRAAFYAGLLGLAFGSWIGVRAFVDGVRSASPSLLGVGLLVVALGVGIDFVLGSVVPGSRGRCRIAFVPRSGAAISVGEVDAKRADDALRRV